MPSIYINFRDTAGFVTDPAGSVFAGGSPATGNGGSAYPVTGAGLTYGWTTVVGTIADRVNTNIAQLAGITYRQNSTGTITFQLDLTGLGGAGQYNIGLALGDASDANGPQYAELKDGSTSLFTVSGVDMTTANNFVDATGVVRAESAWLASQALKSVTFGGSMLTLNIGDPAAAASGFTCLACLYVASAGGSPATPMLLRHFQSAGRVRRR